MVRLILVALVGAVVGGTVTWLFIEPEAEPARASDDDLTNAAAISYLRKELARAQLTIESLAEIARTGPPRPLDPELARRMASRDDPADYRSSRLKRVAKIRGQVDGWFQRGEGQAALDALRALVAMKREGWPLAMELWLRIRNDSGRASALGLSDMAAAGALNDPALHELLVWSLSNDAPDEFRSHAAWSLPWSQPAAHTLEQFTAGLARGEKEPAVLHAFVDALVLMRTDAARSALREALADRERDSLQRGLIASKLVDQDRAAVETAATDPDHTVRAAAKAALAEPTATGFLITMFRPDSAAEEMGVEVGDVIVSYAGIPIPGAQTLHAQTRPWREPRVVTLVVVRDGERLTFRTTRGRLGVFGRDVVR